jgi:hypothetical protein
MRVFDFVGVSEAINEIREDVRSHDKDSHIAAAWAAEPAQKTHVADSQTEESDDDIMLFDGANEHESKKGKRLEPVSLVLVDNITSVINPILKTDYVQGQHSHVFHIVRIMISTKHRTISPHDIHALPLVFRQRYGSDCHITE